MSKTFDLSVTVTCDDEEDYERATDSIMDVAASWAGAMSGKTWDAVPDDGQPQGTGGPAAASNGSERGFDSPPGVYNPDVLHEEANGVVVPWWH